jgi:hypothetical protein
VRFLASFAGADAQRIFERQDKYFSIADLS